MSIETELVMRKVLDNRHISDEYYAVNDFSHSRIYRYSETLEKYTTQGLNWLSESRQLGAHSYALNRHSMMVDKDDYLFESIADFLGSLK